MEGKIQNGCVESKYNSIMKLYSHAHSYFHIIVFVAEIEKENECPEEIIPIAKTAMTTGDETDHIVNANNNTNIKTGTPKLLKKSQSEHLDLLNKNIRSLNGSSAEGSDSKSGRRLYL